MTASKLLGALFAATILTAPAFAQTYPERQITMVVPFSAGGPTDTVARLVAERMSEDLGQQIVIQNVGGAGGTLGASQVAKAEADGYTVLLHHIGMATSDTLYRNLPYETLDAFEYVGLVTEVPMVVTARQDFEPADFPAFIEYVKANADSLTLANAGIGAASHLCGMLLMQALEAPLVTVPYKGTGPAMTDLLGGQVAMSFDTLTPVLPHIQAGKLRPLAVTTAKRSSVLPDVPTLEEAGLSGFDIGTWFGVLAPAATPKAVVAKLSAEITKIIESPDFQKKLHNVGAEPMVSTPEQFAKRINDETSKFAKLVKTANIVIE